MIREIKLTNERFIFLRNDNQCSFFRPLKWCDALKQSKVEMVATKRTITRSIRHLTSTVNTEICISRSQYVFFLNAFTRFARTFKVCAISLSRCCCRCCCFFDIVWFNFEECQVIFRCMSWLHELKVCVCVSLSWNVQFRIKRLFTFAKRWRALMRRWYDTAYLSVWCVRWKRN